MFGSGRVAISFGLLFQDDTHLIEGFGGEGLTADEVVDCVDCAVVGEDSLLFEVY